VKLSAFKQALILFLLAEVPAIGEAVYFRGQVSWHSRAGESHMVSLSTAQSWGDNAIWVDARPDDQFNDQHIPGAVSLNEDHWNDQIQPFVQTVWSPGKKTVVYCSSESCNLAMDVAERLRKEANLPDVYVLSGGWEEWLKNKK